MTKSLQATSTDASVELDSITKSYGPTTIIGDTRIHINDGEFVSLLGPSGCGKSTILKMIAGLAEPSTGTVSTGQKKVQGPGPDRGMVFQDHALLPWMTARGNIDFGLRSARPELSKSERADITRTHLEQVGLTDAADRRPARLSGGMQQRVGLARAFAIDPPIMLLDEPFGALDALTRRELQLQLLGIWEASQRTVVMVTHDVDEAILLSDRVLVMSKSPESTIIADINVDLPRPRHDASEDPAVETKTAELRKEMLNLLEH
ncbi:ABC transporter ATP-binding protein [Corynebacterium sp. J010B-136]|uniref:ABC transporter ATP-binding protein n=1 Tax=Corynebacterium sp. J010B-136 TaxID=2099401 RepID=UPI000CF9B965|nr:ABC transporter ATP-binding protein [Corynebacterium sp. J010B-136]PQM74107.1 taurine ABC transporter [Corynebacterium sp. J010B-136]